MNYDEKLAQAERSVVGAVFLDNNIFEGLGLTPEHFFDPRLKVTWDAIRSLRESKRAIDEVTLADALGTKLTPIGGYAFLSELALEVPTASNAGYYADIVREGWLSREVKLAASEVITQSAMGVAGESLLRVLQSGLERVLKAAGKAPKSLYDVIETELGVIASNDSPKGLPCGLNLEAVVPGGIPRDKVTCIFADAGTFKTTLKNQLIVSMAEAGHNVLDVSLEDSCELTAHRYISRHTGIPYGRIAGGVLTPQEKATIASLPKSLLEAAKRIHTGDDLAPRIGDIIRESRRLLYSVGLSAVVVDYLQLLDGHQKETLDEAMRMGQLAAKRDKVAYIFLSQIKQDVIHREDPRPLLQDMLGSSAMRTASKLAIGLFRPWSHMPYPLDDNGPYGPYSKLCRMHPRGTELYPNLLECWIVKNVLGVSRQVLFLEVLPEQGIIQPAHELMAEYL